LTVAMWAAAPAGSVVGPTAAVSSPATASAIRSFLFIPGASFLPHPRFPPCTEGPAVARSTLLSGSDDCNHQPSFAFSWAARRFGRPFRGGREPRNEALVSAIGALARPLERGRFSARAQTLPVHRSEDARRLSR